jgi:hypothetical protein
VKYYIYISENKIQMLYEQTADAGRGSVEATVGFDVKLLKASIKKERGVPESSIGKLRTVVEELNKNDLVGRIDENKQYIRGTLPLVWGRYGMSYPKEGPITFWGYNSDKIALGMAGSSYHVLGNQREGSAHSHSLTPAILAWFHEHLHEPIPPGDVVGQQSIELLEETRLLESYDIANATWLAVTQMLGERTTYNFVAKVLHRSKWPEGFRSSKISTIILASPLYVAMEE